MRLLSRLPAARRLHLLPLAALSLILALTSRAQFPLQLGSAGQEYGKALCTDPQGNVLVALLFQNTIDFDPGPGTTLLGQPPGVDLALVKYDRTGQLIWARTVSGTGNTVVTPHGVATDAAGNVYVTGYFGNAGGAPATADFDPGPDVAPLTNSGGWDPFFAKYDAAGNFLWARTLGHTTTSPTDERAWDLAVDAAGAVYVTGFFQGTYDLDANPASTNLVTSAGLRDIFLVKYDAAGNHVWGFALGDIGDAANGLKETSVALDARGHVFLYGHFNGEMDFDPSPTASTSRTSAGASDLFVARYSTDGAFQRVMQITGPGAEVAPPGTLRVNRDGDLVLTGRFRGAIDIDPSAATRTLTNTSTSDNVFVASYSNDLDLRWGFSLVSDGSLDGGHRVAFDRQLNVYVAGWFGGTIDFDGGPGTFTVQSTNSNGASDVFLAKYSPTGNFLWAATFGGTGAAPADQSIPAGLALDSEDHALITGQFYGRDADFDPSPTAQRLFTSVGDNDCFVIRYTPDGRLWTAETAPPLTSTRLLNLATRAQVGPGADALFPGFVVGGTAPRTLLIRAIGPGLAAFNVTGTLADPRLTLFNGPTPLASNDDWGTGADLPALAAATARTGAFALPAGSKDAALLVTLAPGPYSARVEGASNTTGVALVEVYDASIEAGDSASQLINLSARALVGTGDGVLIPGLVISGTAPQRVLIRAVGPTLSAFGVTGVLADPTLTIFSGSTALASNDNWQTQSDSAAVATAAAQVGAFALPAGSRDSALVLTLAPGAYTCRVAGAATTTGVALVEVYVLPATLPSPTSTLQGEATLVQAGHTFLEGIANAPDGSIYFSDARGSTVQRLASSGALTSVATTQRTPTGLAWLNHRLLIGDSANGSLVTADPTGLTAEETFATTLGPVNDVTVDAQGGAYFSVPVARAPVAVGVYYVERNGRPRRLPIESALPNGVRLAPDGQTLFVVASGDATLTAYPVTAPGQIGAGRLIAQLQGPDGTRYSRGGDGFAISPDGIFCVTVPAANAVHVLDATGQTRGWIRVPTGGQMTNCALGGPGGRTLFITTSTALYRFELPAPATTAATSAPSA